MGKLDTKQKLYFEDPKRFADAWNGVLYGGRKVIAWEELLEVDSVLTYADQGHSLERIGDAVFKRTAGGEELAILVLENQGNVDYSMPARIFMTEALAYDKQVRAIKQKNKRDYEAYGKKGPIGAYLYRFRREDKLRPVCTLVLWWNTAEWDGARSLHEMIDFRGTEELKGLVPEYPIHLVDMRKIRDEKVFQTDLRTMVALFQKKKDKVAFKEYCDNCEEKYKLVGDAVLALEELIESPELAEYHKRAKEKEQGKELEVCQAITDLIED